jgi:hypothetical protein
LAVAAFLQASYCRLRQEVRARGRIVVSVRIGAPLVLAFVCVLSAPVRATDTYDYKPGEFRIVKDGRSPDKKLNIMAGETKSGAFGVFLFDAVAKKSIGQLEEVATGLDSGWNAYHAHWSPDSKHVAISSRSDRHSTENIVYRIENRHAYLVDTPELKCHAVPDFCQLEKELGGTLTAEQDDGEKPWKIRQTENYSEIMKWLTPTRFILREEGQFQVKEKDPSAAMGKYAEVEKDEGDEAGAIYHVWFSAEGECELLPGDKTRVVNSRPVKDAPNKD